MLFINKMHSTIAIFFISLFIPQNALADRIPNGFYTPGAVDSVLEVRGNKYRAIDEQGTHPWRSTSELVLIKKGVIEERSHRGSYYCSSYPKKSNSSYVCARNGWKKISM
jgi:hypothetical protein